MRVDGADAAAASPYAAPDAAAIDPWLASTHGAVRVCVSVARGSAGRAAAAAELTGDGDDPGDAVFAVEDDNGVIALLTGAAVAPLGAASAPTRARALARPPAPPLPPPGPAAVVDPGTTIGAPLMLNALAFVPRGASGEAAAAALRRALARQLAAAAATPAHTPCRFAHFQPPGWRVPVSLPLPLPPAGARSAGVAAAETGVPATAARAALGARLRAPPHTPCLRLSACVHGDDESDGTNKNNEGLLNVHTSIPSPPPPSYTITTVSGAYRYRHYCMDGFDDAGWGCAYRSLQTLASWLQENHYTHRAPPTHAEIQSTLVSLCDKPPSFADSKQWMGALELSYVLDGLYGVTCKVLAIPSGADVPSHARALASHFATHGTPVMVGGGVLAYTLLGVAHDEASGDVKFLILDPHYVGPDALPPILSGGWVAWKGVDDKAAAGGPLFVKDAFYNLLCPQRPQVV